MASGKRLVESVSRDMANDVALVEHFEQVVARTNDVDDSPYVSLEQVASTDCFLSKHRTTLPARGMCCLSRMQYLLPCYVAEQAVHALGVVWK